MAHLSDVLLQVAVVVYLAAMTGYLVEYAFGTRGAVARVAGRRERALVMVGAPASVASASGREAAPEGPASVAPISPVPVPDTPASAAPQVGRTAAFGAVAVALTAVAIGLHVAVLVTRGLAADRVPWGNMYEFVVTL